MPKKVHLSGSQRTGDRQTVDNRRVLGTRHCLFPVPGGYRESAEEGGLGAGYLGGEGILIGGLEYVVFYDGAAVG